MPKLGARVPLVERFWNKVNKDGPMPSSSAIAIHSEIAGTCCWIWTAGMSSGYGTIWDSKAGRIEKAPRVAWLLATGKHPGNKKILHKCDNPACVRFSHLFRGSDADNATDMYAKGRGKKARGSQVSLAKLTEAVIPTIRNSLAEGQTAASIARNYGVTPRVILLIKWGETWKHVEAQS